MDSARWQRITEWPLTVAALVFLGFCAWAVLADLEGPHDQVAQAVITATWALSAFDYFVRLFLADRRLQWFWRHLLDLAIVALPILRPLRLIRLLTLLAIFQRVAGKELRLAVKAGIQPCPTTRCVARNGHRVSSTALQNLASEINRQRKQAL